MSPACDELFSSLVLHAQDDVDGDAMAIKTHGGTWHVFYFKRKQACEQWMANLTNAMIALDPAPSSLPSVLVQAPDEPSRRPSLFERLVVL
jgi:hypothetical protein